MSIEPIHQWQWHSKVDPTCLQSLVKLCRDRKLLFEQMYLAHHDHFHGRDHCSPHWVGLGAGGRWALQIGTLPYTFHWKDTDCIIQPMNFPAPHIDGTRGQSWHGNFDILFRPVSLHSGNSYLAEQMVRLKTDENGMKTQSPCQIQDMRQWRRKQNTQPYMSFMACSNTSRRPWHGSMCCIGWCSETCRIEWTCGCRTKILRNTAKLLKAILIVSLAFPICALDVFHALERTGWILKESPKFTMVQQVK